MRVALLPTFVATVIAALVAIGCSSSPGVGSGTGQYSEDITRDLADYLVVDLQTGTLEGRTTIADLATAAAYRDRLMVFRRIAGGTFTAGAASGSLGAGTDPSPATRGLPRFYLAVFETTQDQWVRIAGTSPWMAPTLTVTPAGSLGTLVGGNLPAINLSYEQAQTALTSFAVGKTYSFALPTDDQWECACRGGSTTPFWWGSSAYNRTAAADKAVVLETVPVPFAGQPGVAPVGSKLANPFGLYDMHGNVWELTRTGTATGVRGGSWRDPLALARASLRQDLDRGTAHALVGLRLVLIP